MANQLEIITLSSTVDLEKVKKFRELSLKGLSGDKDASEAAKRSKIILTELIQIVNPEITELWRRYPTANYIGVRFDQQQAIIGINDKDIYAEAKKIYRDQPLLDYMASKRPVIIGGAGG